MATVHLSNGRRFDPATGEVVVGDRVTRLEPQPAALLALLASRPGELVPQEEIRLRLWADGRHVDYTAGLHYAVRQVRRALGGDGGDIETLPRRGYRLRAAAMSPGDDHVATASRRPAPAAAAEGRRRAVAVWAVAAGLSATLIAVVERRPNDHHHQMVKLVRLVHDVLY